MAIEYVKFFLYTQSLFCEFVDPFCKFVDAVLGNNVDAILGNNVDAILGLDVDAILGLDVDAILGNNVDAIRSVVHGLSTTDTVFDTIDGPVHLVHQYVQHVGHK